MIFEVYLLNPDAKGQYKEQLLYYPNDETFVITNSKLELALDEAGSFEFDIPSCNLRYDDFLLRKSMISVRQNDKEIFYGEVREVTQNFDYTKHVYAVGELAFLFDSIQPQKMYNGTPYDMLKAMLTYHNSQVESRKKYEIGYVNSTDNKIYHFTNREDTLTDIREKLCKTLDIHIRVRKVGTTKYIDLVPLTNYGTYCKQEIQFGENLLDFSRNMSAADIATCCVPLGKRLEDNERTGNCPNGLDEYLTIVGTSTDAYHKNKDHDYVVNDSAVAQFGYVRVVKNWDDVTVKENLKTKAINWLKSAQYETMTLEINALDMNLLDVNIDSFDVGDTIHAWALPFGMDTTFPVQKKTIHLNDLDKNTVVLGNSFTKSYTKQASNAIERLFEEIPEITPILKSAKDNALSMLLDATTGGHVVYEYDANNYITAINICNASTIKASTQRWVWNLNGFGFMSRPDINSNWKDIGTAITMDGAIVADFITAGVMSANRVRGGIFEVGGTGFAKDGSIAIYNSSGVEIGRWSKTGIVINEGAINLGKYDTGQKDAQGKPIYAYRFNVNNNGSMSATSGNIAGWKIEPNRLSFEQRDNNNNLIAYTYLNSNGTIEMYRAGHGKTQFDAIARVDCYQLDMHDSNEKPIAVYKNDCVNWTDDPNDPLNRGAYKYTLKWSKVITADNFSTAATNSGLISGSGCDGQIITSTQRCQVKNGLITEISTY